MNIVHDLHGGNFCCFSAFSRSSLLPKLSKIGGWKSQLANVTKKLSANNNCLCIFLFINGDLMQITLFVIDSKTPLNSSQRLIIVKNFHSGFRQEKTRTKNLRVFSCSALEGECIEYVRPCKNCVQSTTLKSYEIWVFFVKLFTIYYIMIF